MKVAYSTSKIRHLVQVGGGAVGGLCSGGAGGGGVVVHVGVGSEVNGIVCLSILAPFWNQKFHYSKNS